MPSWLSLWGIVRPMFNFTASKFVVIKDWRLGLVLRSLQLCVLCYLVTNIMLGASYLAREIPTGIIVSKPVIGDLASSYESQFEFVQNGSLQYCTNSQDYDFQWSKDVFENFRCAISDLSTLARKSENEFFLTTSYARENSATITKDIDGKCSIDENLLKAKSQLIFEGNNICVFSSREAFFPVAPEDLVLNLLHGYRTSSATGKNGDLPWTAIKSANPAVSDVIIEEGGAIHLALNEWLSLANVDLDQKVKEENGGQLAGDVDSPYEGQYPMPRVSGVRILLTFNYYQRKLAPKPYKKASGKHANEIICVVDVTPHYTWTSRAPEINYMMNSAKDPIPLYPDFSTNTTEDTSSERKVIAASMSVIRTGVGISFQTKGSIGSFSTSALIAALVAGSVMLGIAQTLVTYIALYALGLSSQLYREFLRESVDWRKEYARYAAQALVAGFAFMSYDRDHSGKLDRREIFKVLNTVLGHRLSENTVAALTDFVMRQGESDGEVDKGKFTGISQVENTISIEEWIDIFTQEKVQMSSLQRLIDNEYSDQADLELLTKLATRPSHRLRALSTKSKKSVDIPLLEDSSSADDSDEVTIDPEYAQYTKNKRAFFADFFMCNDPKAVSSNSLQPEFESEHKEKEAEDAGSSTGGIIP